MSDDRAVELILDASGSMRGESIEDAKKVLKTVVGADLPADLPVALRVFGLTDGCSSDLVMPLTPLTKSARKTLQKKIEGIEANGDTMIAGSLAFVKDDLASATGERHVVLVTDGDETCGGDVEEELEKLKKLGFDVRVDIVGIAPEDSPFHDTFEKWAKVAGGAYLKAHDSDKLHDALKKVLPKRPWWVRAGEHLGEVAEDVKKGDFKEAWEDVEDAVDDLKS